MHSVLRLACRFDKPGSGMLQAFEFRLLTSRSPNLGSLFRNGTADERTSAGILAAMIFRLHKFLQCLLQPLGLKMCAFPILATFTAIRSWSTTGKVFSCVRKYNTGCYLVVILHFDFAINALMEIGKKILTRLLDFQMLVSRHAKELASKCLPSRQLSDTCRWDADHAGHVSADYAGLVQFDHL